MEQGSPQFAQYPSLRDRVVLVTGGATGIGESLVAHFARQGSRVAFLDIQDEPATELAARLAAEGCPQPEYLHCDLTDVAELKCAVEHGAFNLGNHPDVLVNNAANDQRHSIGGSHSRILRRIDSCESALAVLHDSKRFAGHAQCSARVHNQHEFHFLDDPDHWRNALHSGEGCDHWIGPERWRMKRGQTESE